jgi:TM2 domain-containing membrane protein YozV
MILFILISALTISYTRSEETEISKINMYNSEIENLQGYEHAKSELLRNLQQFQCTNDLISCSGHGRCNDQRNDCICDSGFSTVNSTDKKCNYQMKKQLVAFLCELFLGFGAGHFYAERYLNAALKLSAFLYGIYIICLFPISAKCISDRCENDFLVLTVSCFYYCCAIGLAFWFIYDLVMFGMNKYLDGNQIQLLPWGVPTQ